MMDPMKTTVLSFIAFSVAVFCLPCPGQTIDEAALSGHFHREIRPVLPRPDTVSMVFLGDIMMHSEQLRSASERFRRSGMADTNAHYSFDFSQYFSDIRKYIDDADLAVANMEFTLGGQPFSGYPEFSAPDSYAEYMAGCGIDVFLTANNHILDRGEQGIRRTLEAYERLGKRFGTLNTGSSADSSHFHYGNPLLTEVKGMKIALVNFTYGTNKYIAGEYPKVNRAQKRHLQLLMEKAEESAPDIIVALPHWGEEYSLRHSRQQYMLAGWLASQGADIIIGTHPHVVQDSTVIRQGHGLQAGKNVPVVYSLGNAISNMSAPDTQIGLMVKVSAVRQMNGKVKILPLQFTYLWCSLPGRLKDTHCTVPVKEYITKPELWKMPYEYEKMTRTYYKVKKETGIQD